MKYIIFATIFGLSSQKAAAAGYSEDIATLIDDATSRESHAQIIPSRFLGLEQKRADLLAKEAYADPDKFVDEHTPYEISLVYGLPLADEDSSDKPSRYAISAATARKKEVRITVNLSTQRLLIEVPGSSSTFKISSGLPPKYSTPGSGKCFAPDFMEKMHFSSLYNKAPMPHSVFFNGNIALHATLAEHLLGRPASHGCIRLSRENAKKVFTSIQDYGKENTSICVTGTAPAKPSK